MKKYRPPSADLTVDAIKEFVKGYLDGTLKVVFILYTTVLCCESIVSIASFDE